VICVLSLILGSVVLALHTPTVAQAATVGRMVSIGGWQIGSFLTSDGRYAYCIEPGAVVPSGKQQAVTMVTSLPAYSGGTFDPTGWRGSVSSGSLSGPRLRQINYLLSTTGHTADAKTAAAVQLAVWILRNDPGVKRWLVHHLDWARAHGGAAIVDHAYELARDAQKRAVAPAAPKAPALVIERDPSAGDHQSDSASSDAAARPARFHSNTPTGRVKYPVGMTRLSIDGGRFADGALQIETDPTEAGAAEWRADERTGSWADPQEVTISGEWSADGQGWPARLKLFPPQRSGEQRLVAGAGPETVTFTGSNVARDEFVAEFEPVLSSRVATKILGDDDPFHDTIRIWSASGDWPRRMNADGEVEFAPIVAQGTVYGPFATPQEVRAEVPEGAPVAGRATIAATRGPGEYTIEAERGTNAHGYFFWVWEIAETEQEAEVRAGGFLPENYVFRDRFGIPDEGHVVPMSLRWQTNLDQQRLAIRDLVIRDRLIIEPGEWPWLEDETGARVPARIRLTAYGVREQPERRSSVPADANELAHTFVTVEEAGREVAAPPMRLPSDTRGWVTVRACLLDEDQLEALRGLIAEWCDDFGVPAESARIVARERLAQTGEVSALSFGSTPLLGLGLVGSGASALIVGGCLRSWRGRRTRV